LEDGELEEKRDILNCLKGNLELDKENLEVN
jgi:hypothetical protein